MPLAHPLQTFQNWFTQQWVLLWGRRLHLPDEAWLDGPSGNLHGIGNAFIGQLAEAENLHLCPTAAGLLPSIEALHLPPDQRVRLAPAVRDFYENTAAYELLFSVHWNPLFRLFGIGVNRLFSRRINQLHLPTHNTAAAICLTSEIMSLTDPVSGQTKYTIWRRSRPGSGQVVYLGLYGACTLPGGQAAIKAVFPLPRGNATVILTPRVTEDGALVLDGSGKGFGEAGFYFLVRDTRGRTWAQYRKTFRDRLTLRPDATGLSGEQVLSLWGRRVLTMAYTIFRKPDGG